MGLLSRMIENKISRSACSSKVIVRSPSLAGRFELPVSFQTALILD